MAAMMSKCRRRSELERDSKERYESVLCGAQQNELSLGTPAATVSDAVACDAWLTVADYVNFMMFNCHVTSRVVLHMLHGASLQLNEAR